MKTLQNKTSFTEQNVYLVNEHINVAVTSFNIQIIATIIRRAYFMQKFINIIVRAFLFCLRLL